MVPLLALFFWYLQHYAVNHNFQKTLKKNPKSILTFENWTFLKCPKSENRNTLEERFFYFLKFL